MTQRSGSSAAEGWEVEWSLGVTETILLPGKQVRDFRGLGDPGDGPAVRMAGNCEKTLDLLWR